VFLFIQQASYILLFPPIQNPGGRVLPVVYFLSNTETNFLAKLSFTRGTTPFQNVNASFSPLFPE
jgi:hypothetical protein